jgi:type IV pilus assembly protein PilB
MATELDGKGPSGSGGAEGAARTPDMGAGATPLAGRGGGGGGGIFGAGLARPRTGLVGATRSLDAVFESHGVPHQSLAQCAEESRRQGIRLDVLVREKSLLPPEVFAQAIAEGFNLPFLPSQKALAFERDRLLKCPRLVARDENGAPKGESMDSNLALLMQQWGFLILEPERDLVPVAVWDAADFDLRARIEVTLTRGYRYRGVEFWVTPRPTLERVLKGVTSEVGVDEMSRRHDVISPAMLATISNQTVRDVYNIILAAVQCKASDIHIEPFEDHVRLRFRIDGILTTQIPGAAVSGRMARSRHQPIVARIKVLSELDLAKDRVPQDGRFGVTVSLPTGDREVDFRVSLLPTIYGETVTIRLLDKKGSSSVDLGRLGMEADQLDLFRASITKPYGLVLIAGPTGSGKTSSLYAALGYTLQEGGEHEKIITVEDPVEYRFPGIIQVQVNEKAGLTFEKGLRSIVRQDPDRVMIGEIRDEETAKIAVNAALTGHLVMSTVHANNVTDAIGRLMKMGINPYEAISSFNLIMTQRLVRILCMSCRAPHPDPKVPAGVPQRVIDVVEQGRRDGTIFRANADGCDSCGRLGYRGRQGIYEMIAMSHEIKELLTSGQSLLTVRTRARQQGMLVLRESAILKVARGTTTFEEVDRVTVEE